MLYLYQNMSAYTNLYIIFRKKYENWKNVTPPQFHSCHDNSSESHILLKFQILKAFDLIKLDAIFFHSHNGYLSG